MELPKAALWRDPGDRTLWVLPEVLMTGAELEEARLLYRQHGWEIALQLTRAGALHFREIAANHLKQRLAIVLDGEAVAAPQIVEPITPGSIAITGNFTEAEARGLAEKLNRAAKR